MISLADAKAHLNLTTDDDDALVQGKIEAASEWIAGYTAGTDADSSTVPAPLKEACRQLVAHLYANREASLVGISAQALPFGLLDLLSPYRAFAF